MISTQKVEKYYGNKKNKKKSLSQHYAHNEFLEKWFGKLFL
jgi:hypothetical protein